MAFVDIVKELDTVNHDLIMDILEHYVAPPKLRSSIARMYTDLKVVLKIGKLKTYIEQTVGMRQGNCMYPVLLIFQVMDFYKKL